MEDAALKVMEAATATEALLAEKAVALGAIRAEFERKQKEVGACGTCLRARRPLRL